MGSFNRGGQTHLKKFKVQSFDKTQIDAERSRSIKVRSSKLKKFRFLPDIAIADLAFEAFGKNYDELFENAGLALGEAMVKLKSVASREKREIKKEEKTLENLLFSYLEELVYLKDAKLMVFNRLKCEIKRVRGERWTVEGELFGEKIDPKRHRLGVDVKAVTKHLFKIEKLPNKTLRAQVILDV